MTWGQSDVITIETDCTRNIMSLNHPKIMRTQHPHTLQSVENLFSMKPLPGAKIVQDHCHRASWFSMCKICKKTFYVLTKRITSNIQHWSHRVDFLKDRRIFSLERFSRKPSWTFIRNSTEKHCPKDMQYKPHMWIDIFSVQFSWSVVSNSLRPHELQHTRLPYPS